MPDEKRTAEIHERRRQLREEQIKAREKYEQDKIDAGAQGASKEAQEELVRKYVDANNARTRERDDLEGELKGEPPNPELQTKTNPATQ